MNKKRFIVAQSGLKSLRLFDAATGQLYRIISTPGNISGQPICLENEMYVQVEKSGKQFIAYYKLPSGSLSRTVPLN
jgi:hypothetical protein